MSVFAFQDFAREKQFGISGFTAQLHFRKMIKLFVE